MYILYNHLYNVFNKPKKAKQINKQTKQTNLIQAGIDPFLRSAKDVFFFFS